MMLRVRPAHFTTTNVVGGGGDVADAQHQLGAGHVDAGRNGDALIFIERPAVEHHQVGAFTDQRIKLVGGNARRLSSACSTNSPNALLGTLTPENSSRPALLQAETPPSSTNRLL